MEVLSWVIMSNLTKGLLNSLWAQHQDLVFLSGDSSQVGKLPENLGVKSF